MTRGAPVPVLCREGCGVRLVFAKRNGRTVPYEADDRPPFTEASAGCHVLIAGQAYTPLDAIEHFHTTGAGMAEPAAIKQVSGHPWHRPHRCRPTHTTGDDAA